MSYLQSFNHVGLMAAFLAATLDPSRGAFSFRKFIRPSQLYHSSPLVRTMNIVHKPDYHHPSSWIDGRELLHVPRALKLACRVYCIGSFFPRKDSMLNVHGDSGIIVTDYCIRNQCRSMHAVLCSIPKSRQRREEHLHSRAAAVCLHLL